MPLTAFHSQDEVSEMWIGEWMESRGVREQMVIATKVCSFAGYLGFEAVCNSPGRGTQYTTNFKRGRTDIKQKSAYVGNSMKSLHNAVEASLRKLRTSYIDVLFVHWVSRLLICLACM